MNPAKRAPFTAASRSASGKTTLAAFPPSSQETRFSVPAASRLIACPVAVEPVRSIFATSGCSQIARPAVGPNPGTMLTTPSGRPASWQMRPNSSTESGASSDGLSTIVFPVASAGAIFFVAMRSGWFHGVIWPTTPRGTRRV